jgi:hypothetical protein
VEQILDEGYWPEADSQQPGNAVQQGGGTSA